VGDAKNIIVKPIAAHDANKIIRKLHYSGKVAVTSRLHLGVFVGNRCGGAMQFGDSIDKRKTLGLVKDTHWRGCLELNRLAFADWLPRNGESRAIAYAMRFIKKTYPWIEWIISYADGTQCGDGTIYRASGFALTGINKNTTMWRLPTGEVIADIITRQVWNESTRKKIGFNMGESWKGYAARVGAVRLPGFQLRYIYFLDPTAKDRLTVPILPFSEIEKRGAGMYKGIKRDKQAIGSDQEHSGGAAPTVTLQNQDDYLNG